MNRALTLLNESGDTTIEWPPENDDEMVKIIERKMAVGVSFYIIAQRKPGQRGRVAGPKLLKNPADALKHRALSIKDEDLSKFVLEGKGTVVPTSREPAQTIKRAKTAREVATGHSVGVQPRRGG
jgi:hypothetical protein